MLHLFTHGIIAPVALHYLLTLCPRSSVGLEQETSKLKVTGSNPVGGTNSQFFICPIIYDAFAITTNDNKIGFCS